jgi:hypothetical protein
MSLRPATDTQRAVHSLSALPPLGTGNENLLPATDNRLFAICRRSPVPGRIYQGGQAHARGK